MQGLLLLLVRGLPLLATEVGSRHVGITPVALGTAWDQIGRKQQQIPTDARRSRRHLEHLHSGQGCPGV